MIERSEPLATLLLRRNAVRDFAAACGISTAAVAQWRRIPARHVATIAGLTGMSVSELRPETRITEKAA